jgi:hypothetical protein
MYASHGKQRMVRIAILGPKAQSTLDSNNKSEVKQKMIRCCACMGQIRAPQALICWICWLNSQQDTTRQIKSESIIGIWCGCLWRFTLSDAFPATRSITRSEFKNEEIIWTVLARASSNSPGVIWADEDDLHLLRRTQGLRHGGPVARVASCHEIKQINSLSHSIFHVESKSNLCFW